VINCNYGTNVKVERSTYDIAPRLWVFVRNSETGPVKGVLNLDYSQATKLANELNRFIRGEI
jgi:hypothetical protein